MARLDPRPPDWPPMSPLTRTGLFFALLIMTADVLEIAIFQVEGWIGAGTETTTIIAFTGAVVAVAWMRRVPPSDSASSPSRSAASPSN